MFAQLWISLALEVLPVKGREFEALSRRYMLPSLPGFATRSGLTFARPVIHLLRGFYFESSGFDGRAFYLWTFIQPLYVPSNHIYFLFAKRLSGSTGEGWDYSRDNEAAIMSDVLVSVQQQGLSFLAPVQTPRDLALKAPLLGGHPDDPHVAEAVAYSLVLAHEHRQAIDALDGLKAMIQRYDLTKAPYLNEVLERGQLVRERLASDPSTTVDLLEEWNEQTRVHLRLPTD
jgi:hypothetical protein